MLQGAVTLLLVSHNSGTIEKLCEKALWLQKGEVVMAGSAKEVCTAYEEHYEQKKRKILSANNAGS